MAVRKRIGLSYSYNENWIGGTYYIQNLISALATLPDIEKPHIVIIINHQSDLKAAKNKLSYPYLNFQWASGESNRFFKLINKISRRLLNTNLFSQKIKNLDSVFPYYECVQQSLARKKIYWIADFQEHFAPEFFNTAAVEARKAGQFIIQASSNYLILSSNNALQHFRSLYPHSIVKTEVLPFAVSHPNYKHLDIKLLLKKYDIPESYFICPNQFWKHKNQSTVLKAIYELKQKGIPVTVVFTGNTSDYRNPDYFTGLKTYVAAHDLADNVKFLGFIDRLEQLQLMNNSLAIIQSSLFEGWSTVVEDAKAMNKFLIVSNIAIHHEQLINSEAMFFDPLNEKQLAYLLQKTDEIVEIPGLYAQDNYQYNICAFGRNFLTIVN